MFSKRLRSVVSMNPAYLAQNDGSNESAGRGSGVEKEREKNRPHLIPYMQMTFAPLERRLDTAIYRAMFASSARQARQFVVHGAVKVNGKKVRGPAGQSKINIHSGQMKHPGYLLNPGDLFQVNPERVMFATGAPKESGANEYSRREENKEGIEKSVEAASQTSGDGGEGEIKTEISDSQGQEDIEEEEDPRAVLKGLLTQSKSILSSSRQVLSAKRKQDLRAFQKSVRRTLSRSGSNTILTDSLEAQFLELQNQLQISKDTNDLSPGDVAKDVGKENSPVQSGGSSTAERSGEARSEIAESVIGARDIPPHSLSNESSDLAQSEAMTASADNSKYDTSGIFPKDLEILKQALIYLRDNPIDPSRPYATPWQPRDYMSAFAYVPRYLEVNPTICAAIYVRHPVARAGSAEVPTPFPVPVSSSAFGWYLRRR